MKDYELLAKTLKRYPPLIRYHKDKIELVNKANPKQSIIVDTPSELIPIIKRVLTTEEPVNSGELDKVWPYILQIVQATGELDLLASTPAERKLKIAAGMQCLEDKKQNFIEQSKRKKKE